MGAQCAPILHRKGDKHMVPPHTCWTPDGKTSCRCTVELPILSHLGSIARNGAGLSQGDIIN